MSGQTTTPVYRDGRVHVCAEQCSTCIFRPGNLMRLEPGRVKGMVTDTRSKPGGNIPCHQTLSSEQAICRGWWDAYAADDPIMRLAVGMGVVTEQPITRNT